MTLKASFKASTCSTGLDTLGGGRGWRKREGLC